METEEAPVVEVKEDKGNETKELSSIAEKEAEKTLRVYKNTDSESFRMIAGYVEAHG
jgi:hypothetical protein